MRGKLREVENFVTYPYEILHSLSPESLHGDRDSATKALLRCALPQTQRLLPDVRMRNAQRQGRKLSDFIFEPLDGGRVDVRAIDWDVQPPIRSSLRAGAFGLIAPR